MTNYPRHNIRIATLDDIPRLCDLTEMFFAEANMHPMEFDSVPLAGDFGGFIGDGHGCVLVAEHEGEITGFLAFDFRRVYARQYFAHLFLLFVLPDYRKSDAWRKLEKQAEIEIKRMKEEAGQSCEICRFYISYAAGFNDDGKSDRSLVNSYLKAGFTPVGHVFYKDIL